MERKNLYQRIWGEGERVVLLHGGGIEDQGRTWFRQRILAQQYQLIVPDRRGYGQSPQREGPWTFEDDAADIRPLLGEQAHLVGFSAGGIVALLIAGRWPTAIRSLTPDRTACLWTCYGSPRSSGVGRLVAASLSYSTNARSIPGSLYAGTWLEATGPLAPGFASTPRCRSNDARARTLGG